MEGLEDFLTSPVTVGVVGLVVSTVWLIVRKSITDAKWIDEKTVEAAEVGVIDTFHKYVEARKLAAADGKLTRDERVEARAKAMTAAKVHLRKVGVSIFTDVDEAKLLALIEAAVRKFKGAGKAAAVLLCAAMLAGCATWTPALGGKTSYKVAFEETVPGDTPTDPVTTTSFKVDIKSAAGDVIKDATKFFYNWDDAGGTIRVNAAPDIDTTGQALAIQNVSQVYAEVVSGILPGIIQTVMSSLSPFGSEPSANGAGSTPSPVNLAIIMQRLDEYGRLLNEWKASHP